jgi:hypothetical protein
MTTRVDRKEFIMAGLRFSEIIDEFDYVDDPDVLEKAKTNVALSRALELSRPKNWQGSGLTPEQILPVAIEGGIPVAGVPPARVLKELVAAKPDDRIRVLMANESEIVIQCQDLLGECHDPWLFEGRTLVQRALDAYKASFHEAAMALAVAVGEELALWASEPRVKVFISEEDREQWERERKGQTFGLAKLELAGMGPVRTLKRFEVLRSALIGPIPKFFTPFYNKDGEPIPNTVSRHATVHKPTVAHFSRENALLALMLCVSILREQQDWAEEVRLHEALTGD